MKKLILITGEFPFFKRETFLESEIIYLSKVFDEILIVPTLVGKTPRPLPGNVNVDLSFSKNFKSNLRKLRPLVSLELYKGLLSHKKLLKHQNAIRRINSFISDALITKEWLEQSCPYQGALIYTYWFNGKTYGASLFAKSDDRFKVVSRAHRYDLYDYWHKPSFWPLRQKSINLIDRLFLISDDGYNYLNEKYVIQDRCKVAKLGVQDPKVFTKRSEDNVLRIVSVSGLFPVKRVDLLATFICKYAKEFSSQKIEWVHMGDGVMKEEIINFLESNVPSNLRYIFKGHVRNSEVFQHFKEYPVDLFINVSLSEGLPVSIMEAQACGIIVAATNVGGVSEIVKDETGFLLPEKPEYSDLKQVFNQLLNNNSLVPQDIKTFWMNHHNAAVNYTNYANELVKL